MSVEVCDLLYEKTHIRWLVSPLGLFVLSLRACVILSRKRFCVYRMNRLYSVCRMNCLYSVSYEFFI